MTELRQRFDDDLELAGYSERTREAYLRSVRQLANHYGQSPDTLTETQVRDYFIHLKTTRKFAPGSLKVGIVERSGTSG